MRKQPVNYYWTCKYVLPELCYNIHGQLFNKILEISAKMLVFFFFILNWCWDNLLNFLRGHSSDKDFRHACFFHCELMYGDFVQLFYVVIALTRIFDLVFISSQRILTFLLQEKMQAGKTPMHNFCVASLAKNWTHPFDVTK